MGGSAFQGFPTEDSMNALRKQHYHPYSPFRGLMSPFFQRAWGSWPVTDDSVPGLGDQTPLVTFQFQPLGTWEVEGAVTDEEVTMGHISNIVEIAEEGGMNKFMYKDATLNQDFDMGFLSKNKESANAFDPFLDANFAASGKVADTDARAAALAQLQNGRCTNLWSSAPNNEQAQLTDENNVNFQKSFPQTPTDGACYSASAEYLEDIDYAGVKDDTLLLNVHSRMIQREALIHAQCASFIAIIIVQWADLVICKTRWLSITEQGMKNPVMNFALVFELLLGAALCYVTAIGTALGTRNLRVTHWFTAMPFSIYIFLYDETRKYLMRTTSTQETDKVTGRTLRNPGWLERNTYY
jgi:sodium/potassium-transporting ATPase subunit alpha